MNQIECILKTIDEPTEEDVRSLQSDMAPDHVRKTREKIAAGRIRKDRLWEDRLEKYGASHEAFQFINSIFQLNFNSRPSINSLITHPYVRRPHKDDKFKHRDELTEKIRLPISDETKISNVNGQGVATYRDEIYKMIRRYRSEIDEQYKKITDEKREQRESSGEKRRSAGENGKNERRLSKGKSPGESADHAAAGDPILVKQNKKKLASNEQSRDFYQQTASNMPAGDHLSRGPPLEQKIADRNPALTRVHSYAKNTTQDQSYLQLHENKRAKSAINAKALAANGNAASQPIIAKSKYQSSNFKTALDKEQTSIFNAPQSNSNSNNTKKMSYTNLNSTSKIPKHNTTNTRSMQNNNGDYTTAVHNHSTPVKTNGHGGHNWGVNPVKSGQIQRELTSDYDAHYNNRYMTREMGQNGMVRHKTAVGINHNKRVNSDLPSETSLPMSHMVSNNSSISMGINGHSHNYPINKMSDKQNMLRQPSRQVSAQQQSRQPHHFDHDQLYVQGSSTNLLTNFNQMNLSQNQDHHQNNNNNNNPLGYHHQSENSRGHERAKRPNIDHMVGGKKMFDRGHSMQKSSFDGAKDQFTRNQTKSYGVVDESMYRTLNKAKTGW